MVYFHSSISLCKSVDQPPVQSSMANYVEFGSKYSKSRQSNQFQRNRRNHSLSNSVKIPPCDRSRSAMIDVVMFIAVVIACGFLFFPYVELLVIKSFQIMSMVCFLIKEEVSFAPYVYISIGLSVVCAALATWGVIVCTSNKCGNPNCKGLKKAAEFDIQLETEDCVKNSPSFVKDGGVCKKGLFELPRDHHKELEAELKKMAPINGRAVLVLRARCGCSVGRLEVPGPTKKLRKIKKQILIEEVVCGVNHGVDCSNTGHPFCSHVVIFDRVENHSQLQLMQLQ